MNVLPLIALRNLVRQKRRNILLGSAIAFGMLILVLANSFSHGLSDVIFNRILRYTSGHISVAFSQNGNMYRMLFKDGDRMLAIAKREIPDVSNIEEAIGIMTRVIGNAATDNAIMVGVDPDKGSEQDKKEAEQNFKMLTGSFMDLMRSDVENPVLLAEQKAKALNVKYKDILRVRFQDIHGQNQAARLTVVGIFKPANVFMAAPIFLWTKNLKRLGGYGPHDIGQLYILLNKDPKKYAVGYADKLHAALEPKLAAAYGTMQYAKKSSDAIALCFKNDSVMRLLLADSLKAINSAPGRELFFRDGVVLTHGMAHALGIKPGDTCVFTYRPKYETADYAEKLAITAVLAPTRLVPENAVLVNEREFYGFFYDHWPRPVDSTAGAGLVPVKSSPIYGALAPEWLLLKRTKTTQEMQKQTKEVTKLRSRAFTVNVQSMYESASMVVNLEKALNLITFAAVMILFFIILIGVVNTLRMTIRERTREIGTIRAIGMQKKDVRNSFLLETGFLALFSSVGGTILGFAAMAGLSLIKINAQDNPLGMLLVNGHLNFAPTFIATVGYNVLIVVIAVVTAFFPAKRAANMSAAAAFRHYE
jgi:ABC-type lipoprotein release transport system permease subunit